MAGGTGSFSIAADLHIPEQCLSEGDGFFVVLKVFGEIWRKRHRDGIKRARDSGTGTDIHFTDDSTVGHARGF
jgi:hypothetical protein